MKSQEGSKAAERLNGSEILVRALAEEGVEYVFGYPGGSVLNIFDAIYKQDKFKHILVRHEQAAAHAADAYSRASNKVGVALVTSGPGATNAVTGIATAYADSIPMVIFTGQVNTSAIGQDAFQEVDIVGISRPCVKHNFLVKDVKDLTKTIKKAFYIAKTGRPGPVLIDIPKDVSAAICEYQYPENMELRSYKPLTKGHLGQIKKALQLILSAERPLIHIGGGIVSANASELLQRLAFELGIPVNSTLMGLGAMPSDEKKFLGMVGMHGTYEANMAMQNCDVLIAIGSRFDDRVVGLPSNFAQTGRKIIHIDIDPSTISKRVKVDIPIVGDVKEVIADMLNLLETTDKRPDPEKLAAWQNRINGWREKDCLHYENSASVIKPQYVLQKLQEIGGDDMIVATDVGQHQLWSAQYNGRRHPRQFLTSGGLGTMGFGYGAAIGAQMALGRDQRVVMFTGDGSFHMNLNEACTAVSYELPIITVIFNNQVLGMVRQWQTAFYGKRFSQTDPHRKTNFVKLAEGFGLKGYHCENLAQFQEAFADALKQKGPTWIECMIDKDEKVLPMIPGGGDINDIIMK